MPGYAALYAVILNLAVAVVLSLVFNAIAATRSHDETSALDYG